MRTHADLFSGIGGFALAAQWAGVQTIAFSEIDSYANRVLQRRFPGIRNYGDVRNVPSLSAWLVTGGVPCQPASIAGKRRGAEDDRWLWPEALAAVERIKPTWICLENPLGILSLEQPGLSFDLEGYGNIVDAAIRGQGDSWANITGTTEFIFRDLTASIKELGYEVAPVVIPACGLGAWHRRYRVWIMGHSTGIQSRNGEQSSGADIVGRSSAESLPNTNRAWEPQPQRSVEKQRGWISNGSPAHAANANSGRAYPKQKRVTECEDPPNAGRDGTLRIISDSDGAGFGEQRRAESKRAKHAPAECDNWWASEPNVGRVVDGLSARLDRLRGLGNAIVPQVAYQLIKRMIEAEESQ